MPSMKRLCIVPLATAILLLAACDDNPKEWKTPDMTPLTPRLQAVFDKTKTVCFGRFMVDVPASATVVWGETSVSLGVRVYPDGVDAVKAMAQKFIDELKTEKAIYQNHVPLLISADHVRQPDGEIITGYESFEAIDEFKINGYFRLDKDGVVIESRPLREEKDETVADITSIASRLRHRGESEVPTEPGNCIEYAFLKDKPKLSENDRFEHIRIGFRLQEFPDAHLSIYVAPSNPYNPQSDSLEARWKRIVDEATLDEKKELAAIRFLRKSARQIHEWQTGFEVLTRSPDEERSHSHHEFQMKFVGVPHDLFNPYADIQFQTGVANNAAGATKASLSDEEAIAVWDKITSSIRVRPTGATAVKTAETDAGPHLLLGELAATGRTCPQTGWWEPGESQAVGGSGRQHIKAGERMPHVIALAKASMWQKLKGERPSHRSATVWKLVSYDDGPIHVDAAAQMPTVSQATPDNDVIGKDGGGRTTEGGRNVESSPQKKV